MIGKQNKILAIPVGGKAVESSPVRRWENWTVHLHRRWTVQTGIVGTKDRFQQMGGKTMYLVLLGTAYKLIVSKNLPHLNRGKPQKAFGFDSNLSTKIILKD